MSRVYMSWMTLESAEWMKTKSTILFDCGSRLPDMIVPQVVVQVPVEPFKEQYKAVWNPKL